MIADAGDDVLGGERLHLESIAHLEPVTGLDGPDLTGERFAVQTRGPLEHRGERRRRVRRTVHDEPRLLSLGSQRQQVGDSESVVQVPVRQKQRIDAAQPGRAAAHIERQPRRLDAQPGLVPGPRHALDGQLLEPIERQIS